MLTFDQLWPTFPVPGEYDDMDDCDQLRWRGVIEAAWKAGAAQEREACALVAESTTKWQRTIRGGINGGRPDPCKVAAAIRSGGNW